MKIPDTITVAGITYKIRRVNPENAKLNYGVYNGMQVKQTSEIFLNNSLTGDQELQTFMHEITHAICDALGITQQGITIDERFTESFSQILLQVVQQLTD